MMSDERRRVIRVPSAIVWPIVTAAVVALLLLDVVIRAGWLDAFLLSPWLLLAVWFVVVFVYRPHVVTSESGVSVHNILRTVWIPWGAVYDIVLRWQIEFRLFDGERVQSWGAPAKRQTRRSREQPAEREVEILLGMRDAYGAKHPVDADRRVIRSWDLPMLCTLAVIIGWAVASVLIANNG